MADIKTAFRTNSISLDNVVAIFQGNLDPRTNDQGTLTQVPQGSLYIRSNGELYQKTGTANLGFSLITATGSAVTILDTDLSNTLTLLEGSNLTADRNLTFTTGDASRVLTINGNATLNDWFDQNVKTTGAPTFAQMFSTGNVGIGTTSPSARLHSETTLTNTTGVAAKFISLTSATSNGSYSNTAIECSITGYSIPAGVTDSGNKIGVGAFAYSATTNFAGSLNFSSGCLARAGILTASSGASITNTYGVLAEILNSSVGTTITNAYGVYIKNSETTGTITNRFDLYASSSNALNYFAGSVGIGTTSPTSKLVVAGTDNFPLFRVLRNSTPTTTSGNVVAVFEQNVSNNAMVSIISSPTNTAGINFGDPANFAIGAISYSNSSNSMSFQTNNAERMQIDSTGNVGIGTTSPTSKLVVAGTDNFPLFRVLKSSTPTTTSGNVVAVFEQNVSNNAMVSIISSPTNTAGINFGDPANFAIGAISYSNSSNSMSFQTNNAERMQIDSTGNVGIGTTSPATSLHVLKAGTIVTGITVATVATFQKTDGEAAVTIVSSTSALSSLNFGDSDNPSIGRIIYSNASNSMSFTSNSQTRITINNSGLVGIGLLSPLAQLNVKTSPTGGNAVARFDQQNAGIEALAFTGTSATTAGSTILTGKTAHGGTSVFLKTKINGTVYYFQGSTTPA